MILFGVCGLLLGMICYMMTVLLVFGVCLNLVSDGLRLLADLVGLRVALGFMVWDWCGVWFG